MRVTKEDVIRAASDLADRQGLNGVSLKSVAERLGLRTPSLYNHVLSLDDLLRDMAHRGMREINCRMTEEAVGISGTESIQAASRAYFGFMIEHPGVYETIQWAVWHGSDETAEIFSSYQALLAKLISSCGMDQHCLEEITDLLAGLLHGYCTLQLGSALDDPKRAEIALRGCLDTVLTGICEKYNPRGNPHKQQLGGS